MAWYEVDGLTINVGSIAWGDLARTYTDDGNKLGLNEVAAEPGFDYEFVFESIPGWVGDFRFKLNGYYEGSVTHTVIAQAWNYTLSSWASLGTLLDRSSDQTYLFPTLTSTDYVDSGQAKIRFLHATSGTVGHYLRVDQLIMEPLDPISTNVPTTVPPTTVPPTTLVPTTMLTTLTPTSPIPPTTVPVTTVVPTTLVPTTTLTTPPPPTTPPPHNADLDTLFNCKSNNFAGFLFVETSIGGVSLNGSYGLDDLELFVETSITGEVPCAGLYTLEALELFVDTSIEGWGVANDQKKNWVGWSKIGEANFALDLTNDAGFRPMSWPGYVYQVRKLDKNVIIYGSGGVTAAYPVSEPMPTFGFKDMLNVGIKNKTAVCGDEHIHFCIDVLGCLYKITTEGITRLGYEEFLLPLVNPALTWDVGKRRLYISDETGGYIYNENILTGGYANLTGLYRVKESLTAVSPDTLVTKPVAICTDIIDFKRRGLKSIESMQFDAISEVPLFAAIDYRYRKKDEFKTTQWSQLNNEGVAHIRTAGVEFRARLKGLDHGTFDFSYISIQFKFIDQRFTRDPKGELDVY